MERGSDGTVYNVCDGNPSTMTDYFFQVADAAGLPRPPVIPLAEAEGRLSAGMLSYMRESRRLSNRRLVENLGVELRYPNVTRGTAKLFLNPHARGRHFRPGKATAIMTVLGSIEFKLGRGSPARALTHRHPPPQRTEETHLMKLKFDPGRRGRRPGHRPARPVAVQDSDLRFDTTAQLAAVCSVSADAAEYPVANQACRAFIEATVQYHDEISDRKNLKRLICYPKTATVEDGKEAFLAWTEAKAATRNSWRSSRWLGSSAPWPPSTPARVEPFPTIPCPTSSRPTTWPRPGNPRSDS